jgi:hypothetical protein
MAHGLKFYCEHQKKFQVNLCHVKFIETKAHRNRTIENLIENENGFSSRKVTI